MRPQRSKLRDLVEERAGKNLRWYNILQHQDNEMRDLKVNEGTTAADAEPGQAGSVSTMNHLYDEEFYRYIEVGSVRSARVVVPLVLQELMPSNVLDVGCGAGAWLAEYRKEGITDYLGVDGAYVRRESLLIPPGYFQSQDITRAFDLGHKYDLVQCLEVGEHVSAGSSRTLIENLCRHGDKVLFSAATPGQGGEDHINEQPFEYWRLLFAQQGYKPFDCFRPKLEGIRTVEPWYRRNILLYVAEKAIPALTLAVACSAIPDDRKIPEMTSLVHKVRARLLSVLPVWCVSKMAFAKHKAVIACRMMRNN